MISSQKIQIMYFIISIIYSVDLRVNTIKIMGKYFLKNNKSEITLILVEWITEKLFIHQLLMNTCVPYIFKK